SIVSDAVRLCGGVNVFAQAGVLAPQVSVESVLAARPDAVLVGTVAPQDTHASLAAWQRHGLPAAPQGHVYGLDADSLYRPGPRRVDAAARLCDAPEQARQASRSFLAHPDCARASRKTRPQDEAPRQAIAAAGHA